jgi:NADH:ubiquinone oxidoreductase subunit 6 (subunit J)
MSIEERIQTYKKRKRLYLLVSHIALFFIVIAIFYLISEPQFSGGFYIKHRVFLIGALFVLLFVVSFNRLRLMLKNVNTITKFYSETGNIGDTLYMLKSLIESKGSRLDFGYLMGSYISLLSITTEANEIVNVLEIYKKRVKSLNPILVQNVVKNLITYHEDNDKFFSFYEQTMSQKKPRATKAARKLMELQQTILYIDYLIRSEQYEQALQELDKFEIKQETDKVVVYSRKATIYFLINDQDNYHIYKEKVFRYSPTLIGYHNLKLLDETGEVTYEPINEEVYESISQRKVKKNSVIVVPILLLLILSFTMRSISNSYQKSPIGDTYTDLESISKKYLDKDVVEVGTLFETDTLHIALFEAYDLIDDDDSITEKRTKQLREVTLGVVYVNDDNKIYRYAFEELNLRRKTEDIILIPLDGYTLVIKDSSEWSNVHQVDYSGKNYPVKLFKASAGWAATEQYNYFDVSLVKGEVEDSSELYFY